MWYVNAKIAGEKKNYHVGFILTMWYVKKKIGRPVVGSPKVLY
ncbi:hypothetical protein QJK47_11315 [Clostridioides difficile]|nr:hypothetical protein [Clostridioides difficile]